MEEVKMNWLSDQNGNLLAPKTLIEAVQNAEGTSLEELLKSSITFADTPIGTVISYMGNTAPKDYLICDGTEYEIVKYKDLAEHIKIEFGSYNHFGGDGTTTFAVPDLRGEFLRGSGENSRDRQGSGANVGEHQNATEHIHHYTFNGGVQFPNNKQNQNQDTILDIVSHVDGNNDFGWRGTETTPTYFTSRPTNTSVLYCIKYKADKKSANIIPQHEYSTEEKIVGTWADGKPIYEITIDLGEWTLNSSLNYDATHLNIDEVIFIDASWHQINQPNYRGTISTTSGIDNRCLYFNGTYIKGASSSFTHRYITIQYTKTTD